MHSMFESAAIDHRQIAENFVGRNGPDHEREFRGQGPSLRTRRLSGCRGSPQKFAAKAAALRAWALAATRTPLAQWHARSNRAFDVAERFWRLRSRFTAFTRLAQAAA